VSAKILQNGGAISGFIALRAGGAVRYPSAPPASSLHPHLLTNMLASVVVARSRSGAGVEL
jgi:hypothetical protein